MGDDDQTREPSVAARRAAAFRATREAHATELAEDYVELIADLIAEHGEARVSDVAEYMGVAQPTAAKVVQRLRTLELVDGRPYRSLFLTQAGRHLAERSRARHEVVVAFLRKLGVPRDVAEIDAEGIEHHVSDATLAVMSALIDGRAAGRLRSSSRPSVR